jgi:Pectate lyase superfamily protein
MNQKIICYICCCVAAIALPLPCGAQTGWVFSSVKTDRGPGMPGATGDGVTDDTAAINRTIAAGGIIYFPPGKYRYIGPMTVPVTTPAKSYRFYGDGPGVSIILFEIDPNNPSAGAGINAPNIGYETLNVDGLTLAAKSVKCGTAIYAAFSESSASFRTATIHNVEIRSEPKADGPNYWTKGIDLYKAQNTVIDKVDITGNHSHSAGPDQTLTGIAWKSSATYKTTGLQMRSVEVKFLQKALETSGWVGGVFLTGFELAFCGWEGVPVVDLAVDAPVGIQGSTFHFVNGHVQGLGGSMRLRNLAGVKISKVHFLHNALPQPASIVEFIDCNDAVVSQSSFLGAFHGRCWDPGCDPTNPITNENGILVNGSGFVRIAQNTFSDFNAATGYAIMITASNNTRITNNLFGIFINGVWDVPRPYYDRGEDTYYWGNNR